MRDWQHAIGVFLKFGLKQQAAHDYQKLVGFSWDIENDRVILSTQQ